MQTLIYLIVSNVFLLLLIVSFIVGGLVLMFKHKPLTGSFISEILLKYFLLFNIGLAYLYNFIVHVFFGDTVAHFIGWAQSPFQAEVGFASLGYSAIGVLAYFWNNIGIRVAAVLGPALFSWGAAIGHIYQMQIAHNFAPGNAGIIFWLDIIIPLLGFAVLTIYCKNHNKS